MDEPNAASGDSPRWFQRVLPMTALVGLLVAVALLALPGLRGEAALSTTRQAQPFVELYFPQARGAVQAMCDRSAAKATVRFVVVSHLERPRRLDYRVSATSDGTGTERRGSVRLRPGQARRVSVEVPDMDTESVVTVALPTRDQLIRLHCAGQRP